MTLTTIPRLICTTLAIWLLISGAAFAACPSDQDVEVRAAGYLANQPLDGYDDALSLADAYCAQAKYVDRIAKGYGEVIGYKVGFTGKATQERFKMTGPALGVLLSKMIIANGSTISPDFGFRTFVEPDMVVTVKDDGIMNATNELEVATHLDEVRAFLELPALQLKKEVKLTGTTLVAFNIAARSGVVGKGAKIQATPTFVQAMADMETVFTDETGTVLQTAPASNLLGHPLRVVLWLIDAMKSRRKTLKEGQIISLGSLGKLFPLKAGHKTYTLTYKGLPGGPISTSVTLSKDGLSVYEHRTATKLACRWQSRDKCQDASPDSEQSW